MPKILPEMGFQKEEIPLIKFDTPLCGALLSYCKVPAQWGCGCAGYAHRVPLPHAHSDSQADGNIEGEISILRFTMNEAWQGCCFMKKLFERKLPWINVI